MDNNELNYIRNDITDEEYQKGIGQLLDIIDEMEDCLLKEQNILEDVESIEDEIRNLDENDKKFNEKKLEKEKLLRQKKKQLEEKRQLEKLEEKMTLQLERGLNCTSAEAIQIFNSIKRYVAIGMITGIPGIMIACTYDLVKKYQYTNKIKDIEEKILKEPENQDLKKQRVEIYHDAVKKFRKNNKL